METQQIQTKITEIIANVTGLAPEEIHENASYVDDLALDSLTLMEIGVDVDYEFKLGLAEERLQKLTSVADTVTLVREVLATKKAVA